MSEESYRGIPEINFDAHRAKKAFIEATADWIVRTDITRFYPSIYTHSVPWAAYGKEKVKNAIKRFDGSLADRIDRLLQACNRGQTIGIPIGPETSRVIAEIISSSTDYGFTSNDLGLNRANIDRLQDDWFIGTATLEQAELALSKIVLCYREFGLEINGSKTSIDRTSLISDQQWVSELGAFLSHNNEIPVGRRLSEFLSLGVRMQVLYPGQPIVNYVIAVIENHRIRKIDAGMVESFLLRAMTLSPSSLNGISRVFINLQHDTGAVSTVRVKSRMLQELARHLENGNTLEAIWLLYTLRGLKMRIRASTIRRFVEVPNSSVLSLILLDMHDKGLVVGPLPIVTWADSLTLDKVNTSGLWLLAYEGIRHGWLTDPYNLSASAVFKPMLDRNIMFYDPSRNVPTSKSVVRRRRYARAQSKKMTFELIQSLRGFNIGDY